MKSSQLFVCSNQSEFMAMFSTIFLTAAFLSLQVQAEQPKCEVKCPIDDSDKVICAFDEAKKAYKLFPNNCAFSGYMQCNKRVSVIQTDLSFCLKSYRRNTRRMFEESCPTFCARYYAPRCAASSISDTGYRMFVNQCYMDIVNCRGSFDSEPFVEVPLSFCSNHHMKAIYKEKVRTWV